MKAEDFSDVARERVIELVDKCLTDLAQLVQQVAGENLDAWGVSDTGFLANSIEADITELLRKLVIVGAIYGPYIEYGTGPAAGRDRYMPPYDPIHRWVKRKLGLGGKEAHQATEAIRWAIWRSGIEPKPFFRNAVETGVRSFPDIVARNKATAPTGGAPGG